ncbi:MAG: zinc ABC transporter substrate-binding protein [Lactobacillales bacterium]|jgi:zinc transport system substrate-binding protein|nr:zinc ABC transporter substrate-binding protein [Lactobacillales bacterium]
MRRFFTEFLKRKSKILLYYSKYCLAFILITSLLSSCKSSPPLDSKNGQDAKLKVIASLFPQYDVAKQLLKDKADVSLLLPPGVESHTFDPSAADIAKICQSDLFLYTGKYMEPWADRVVSANESSKLKVVDVSSGIELKKEEHDHEEHEEEEEDDDEEHEHHDHTFDPHVWLDPNLVMTMAKNIASAACEKSPENKEFFEQNLAKYEQELKKLDEDFQKLVASSKRHCLVFGGRSAHQYFTSHYGLECISVIHGCLEESEPSVKDISKIIKFVKENKIPVIFHEEPEPTKLVQSIAEQTGASIKRFSAIHNVTASEWESGVTYIGEMRKNLENLELCLN